MDDKALEGLRVLLASDDELRAENAITESIIQTPMFLTLDEFQDSVFARVRGDLCEVYIFVCMYVWSPTTTNHHKQNNVKQELESPTELAVYEALLEACTEQRARVALTPDEEGELRAAAARDGQGVGFSPSSGAAAGSAQARLLTLAFRKEKVRVLDEATERFGRLTGKGGGGGSSKAAPAAAAAP